MRIYISFIVGLTLALCLASSVYSICNVYTGPEGELDCRSFTWIGTASGNQWARCVSKDRLKNITNGGLTCIFNYCNYLCMQEYYDLSAGEIYSDCRCASEDLLQVDKTRPLIDDACYRPNSSDCDWYDNCFKQRYQNCTESAVLGPNNGNHLLVVDFERKFCRLSELSNGNVSDLAREWLVQVRKCFFDKISPLIRPWRNERCDDLEEAVFDSFKQCYVKPNLDLTLSLCQIDCKSWWLIFREMKNFYTFGHQKINRILSQYFKFGVKGCDEDAFFSRCWSDNPILAEFKKNFLFYRVRFQTKLTKPDLSDLIYNMTRKFLADQRVNTDVFDWYAHMMDESSSNSFIVYIMYHQGLEELSSTNLPSTSSTSRVDAVAILKSVQISMKMMERKIPLEVMPLTVVVALETCADPMCMNVTSSTLTRSSTAPTQQPTVTKQSLVSRAPTLMSQFNRFHFIVLFYSCFQFLFVLY